MLAKRKKIGSTNKYYHVIVRPKERFTTFKTQGIGRLGRTWKISGKKKTGSWATQKILIIKKDATVKDGYLKGTNRQTEKLLRTLGTKPRLKRGNVFSAKPRTHSSVSKKSKKRHH